MLKFKGSVTHVDATKNFAFARRDRGDHRDAFVSPAEIEKLGVELSQGQRIAFDVTQGDRGPLAVDVELLPAVR